MLWLRKQVLLSYQKYSVDNPDLATMASTKKDIFISFGHSKCTKTQESVEIILGKNRNK